MEIDYKKYTHYFSDGEFWEKLKKIAKKVGLKTTAYALILFYVLKKDDIPAKDRALILGCLGYFILPLDLVPDLAPVIGYSDDIAGMIFAVNRCLKYVDEDIKQKVSNKLKEWFKVKDDYLEELLKNIN